MTLAKPFRLRSNSPYFAKNFLPEESLAVWPSGRGAKREEFLGISRNDEEGSEHVAPGFRQDGGRNGGDGGVCVTRFMMNYLLMPIYGSHIVLWYVVNN